MLGQRLSHYRVLEKLGEGGMGVVYVAEDEKLSREVALKVLPPELASSEHRRKRFEREAKAVAALNHPNIVTVYSVEEAEGTHFITMELVRGKPLSDLLEKDGFPLSRFLDIAIPVADAVAAAHKAGVLHRDLKPENIMVTDEGRVIVLDFGLAKHLDVGDSGVATITKTREGHVVGTPAYMSPEQAEGKSVDRRSDLFSLGIVFYQMLTGRHPFTGETPTAILSSIIKDTPAAVREVKPSVPRELSRIVERSLAKEPSRRFQSAADLRKELSLSERDYASGELGARRRFERSYGVWALVGAGVLAAVVYLLRPQGASVPRFANPVQITSAVGAEDRPSFSPDGERVAYESNQSGNWDIWVAQVGGGEPVNLTADHEGADRSPSWSPDGRHIAFLSDRDGRLALYVMSSLGGSSRKVASFDRISTHSPQWSADGEEIALTVHEGETNSIVIVSVGTLETRRIGLPPLEGKPCLDLSWSPDGDFFACVEAIGRLADVTRLWVVPGAGGDAVPVTDGRTSDWSPQWSTGGRLFFISNRGGAMDLWRLEVRADGEPRTEPVPVTAGLGIRSAAFSGDLTRIAYSKGPRLTSNAWRIPILEDRRATWLDAEQLTFDNAFVEFVDVSPDEKRLALSSDRSGNQDLWLLSLESGVLTPLSIESTPDWAPRWSPDGRQLAFYSYRSGNRDVWVVPSEGGPARQLTDHPAEDSVPTWSPDGAEIAFSSRRSGHQDIWVVPVDGGPPRRVTNEPTFDYAPDYSPDGKWLYYTAQEGVEGGEGGENVLRRHAIDGGDAELKVGPSQMGRVSPDGGTIYFTTWGTGREGDLWRLSLEQGRESPVTDLRGRPGRMGHSLAATTKHIYFTWWEDIGDIWVMDVVE